MSGSCLMVLASCRVRAGLLASGYDCLLYGRTVIQPYEQAKKSGNLGHGGGAKREKGTKLVNNHRKSRSVARAGNDGTFTTEGYGRLGRRPSDRAAAFRHSTRQSTTLGDVAAGANYLTWQ